MIGLVLNRSIRRDDRIRSVAIVIPVHNAEANIEAKILNCLQADYPVEARTIWVVSDGSTDGTVEIAGRYRDRNVRCLEIPERVGKVAAQNRALPLLDAEVIVFTDVGIKVGRHALWHIVSDFGDPTVGVVSCRDQIAAGVPGAGGEGIYIAYDMRVRDLTNRTGSLIGVTGGFYALRRELAETPWDPACPPDFFVALRAIEAGYRVVQDERVLAAYAVTAMPSGEFARKVRTMTRGMFALWGHLHLLNPVRHGLASYQLLGQKLLRWMTPFFLIGLLICSALLLESQHAAGIYRIFVAAQVILYALGALGLWVAGGNSRLKRYLEGPGFFLMSNAAILASWWNLATGKRYTVWEPTKRASWD